MGKGSSISLDRVSPAQIKSLLDLATRSEANSPLPTQAADAPGLRRLLAELCHGHGQSSDLVLDTVCDPETPLEVLRGVKELAKKLVSAATTDPQRHAATILYHAAIASAVAHHGTNISSRPLAARLDLYEHLAERLAEEPLGRVFLVAVASADVQ